jgi:heptaprenyl diphosphate synthase
MFLSTIEFMIPKPVPFLRVGIANLPILMGLEILSPGEILLVVVLKVLGQGLVGGTLISYVFLFSAAGSFASALAMMGIKAALGKRISLVGTSVTGALIGNISQVVLARLLIFGAGAWLIAPPFLALGTVTSALLGIFAERFSRVSTWMRTMRGSR